MSEIQICRMTGLPVNLDDLENYKTEWRRLFDKAKTLCKKDMLRLNKKLDKIESVLKSMYPTVLTVEEPSNRDSWNALMDKYGNIMVTKHRDTGEMFLVIMDEDF